jgi:hypothetical protein
VEIRTDETAACEITLIKQAIAEIARIEEGIPEVDLSKCSGFSYQPDE